MLKDVTLGQYFPINSPLHRLDPRTKIVLLIFLIVAIFMANNIASYALLCLLTILIIGLSRVPARMYFQGLKPLWFVILFTALINVFLTPGTAIYICGRPTHMSWEGLILAGKMALRLVLLITASSALTYTTSPIILTDGIEKLLKPFSRFGLPTHELAMMMSIAIRFIPTLIEETDKIMKAQKARGANFDSGPILQRIRALAPMLIPLFISAFRRADELAVAMESRCYQGGDNRTRLNEIRFSHSDLVAALFFLVFFVAILMLRIFL
ncbi:MAG: energy-coupling factor transporter transmembrane protein EcfT [Ruminococcaceae bacterium]|nr:energy-coupling factor transporter transmembrane protein EcfT [Oscillospiraceae bacterium]